MPIQCWHSGGPSTKGARGWYEAHANRVPLSEGLERAHFAFHTDAGQSFYPSLHAPTVFLVEAIQDDIQAEELRAFYSKGDVGVCLHLGVWHTMPICVTGEDICQTTRGDQDYLAHSVEIDFDLQRGQSIAPNMENFTGMRCAEWVGRCRSARTRSRITRKRIAMCGPSCLPY